MLTFLSMLMDQCGYILTPSNVSKTNCLFLFMVVSLNFKSTFSLLESTRYANFYKVDPSTMSGHSLATPQGEVNDISDLVHNGDERYNRDEQLIHNSHTDAHDGKDPNSMQHEINTILVDESFSNTEKLLHAPETVAQNMGKHPRCSEEIRSCLFNGSHKSSSQSSKLPEKTQVARNLENLGCKECAAENSSGPHGPTFHGKLEFLSRSLVDKSPCNDVGGGSIAKQICTASQKYKAGTNLHQQGNYIEKGIDVNTNIHRNQRQRASSKESVKREKPMNELKDPQDMDFGTLKSEASVGAQEYFLDQGQCIGKYNNHSNRYADSENEVVWARKRNRSSYSREGRQRRGKNKAGVSIDGVLDIEREEFTSNQGYQKRSRRNINQDCKCDFTSEITLVKKGLKHTKIELHRLGKTLRITRESEALRIKSMEKLVFQRFDFSDEYSGYQSSMKIIPTDNTILSELREKFPSVGPWMVQRAAEQSSKQGISRKLTFERIHKKQANAMSSSPQYLSHIEHIHTKENRLPHQKIMGEIIISNEYHNTSPSEEYLLASAVESTAQQAYMICLIHTYLQFLGSSSKYDIPDLKIFEEFEKRRDKPSQ